MKYQPEIGDRSADHARGREDGRGWTQSCASAGATSAHPSAAVYSILGPTDTLKSLMSLSSVQSSKTRIRSRQEAEDMEENTQCCSRP